MLDLKLINLNINANPKRATGWFMNVLTDKDEHLCTLRTWAFDSCGIWELHGVWNLLSKCKTSQDLVDFCKGIQTAYENMPKRPDGWFPKEFLLAVSDNQVGDSLSEKHKAIKKLDSFMNRAHGPHVIHLYRISI